MSGWNTIYNHTRAAMQQQSNQLARLQEETTTGARIIRASDSPAEAYQILNLRSQNSSLQAYMKNIDDADTTLQTMSNSLQAICDLVPRANELLTQAANGTYSADNRMAAASEIDSLLEQAVSQANSQSVGRYLFGGTGTGAPPYEVTRSGGKITSVQYVGSQESLDVPVGPGVSMPTVLSGDQVFRNNQRGAPVFDGSTGAAAGTGTSTARGDVYLTVTHTVTTFASGSGLAAGADGAANDTIIGRHKLTIDAAAHTVSLDDGTAVAFAASDTNLGLTNSAGETTYVNMAGWNGTGGDVLIYGQGTLSIDDGASTIAIDGAANQAVTDSRTGQILYVDSSNITRAGVEPIRMEGTYDIFGALINARDLLLNTRGFSEADVTRLLDGALSSLKEAANGVTQGTTTVGGRQGALQSLRTTLDNASNTVSTNADKMQDADIVDLATQLARMQTLYQATLTSAAKLLKLSILDYV